MAYTKWELTPKERAFVAHCEKQGYQIIVCKQYVSKSKWQIDPNNKLVPVFDWEIKNDTKKFNWQYFENALKIKIELEELRELRKGLMKGYYAGGMGGYDECHTIHEDTVTVKELLCQIREIKKLK